MSCILHITQLLVIGFLMSLPVAALAGTGGPDRFGYNWIDSDEPYGPTYDWVDITGVGTPIFTGDADDVNLGPFPIGFAFPFYGNTFSTFRVSTNGFITFTSGSSDLSNEPLPNTGAPTNLLAVFHDDLSVDGDIPSQVYYHNDGSRLIIQFTNIRRYSQSDTAPPFYTFEAILYPDGTIVYQYHTLGTIVDSSTIGLQNATRDDGLTVAYNTPYAHDQLAVLFAFDSDSDIDGVLDDDDLCPGTVLPDEPTIRLEGSRFAAQSDGSFDSGMDQFDGLYTLDDTAGCSGEQIIELLNLGEGHTMFGISKSALEAFINSVN